MAFGLATRVIDGVGGLVLLAAAGGGLPASVYLETPHHPQEKSNWCWAASAQMLMHHCGTDVPQCEQAKKAFPTLPCPAPPCPPCQGTIQLTEACNQGGLPRFDLHGFRSSRTSLYEALSWDQLKSALHRHGPVAFSYCWECVEGSMRGHMQVAVGYKVVDGRNWVARRNPNPLCKGDFAWVVYEDEYVRPATCPVGDECEHWYDYYKVRGK